MKFIIILPLVVLFAFAGCGRKATAKRGYETEKSSVREVDVQDVLMQADELMQSDNHGDAVALLDKAMANEAYAKDRGWLFSTIMHILLLDNDVDAAKERYLGTIPDDVGGMRAGFGMVSGYYEENKDFEALLEWTDKLMNARLPKDLEEKAFVSNLNARFQLQQFAGILRIIPECVKRFDSNGVRRVVSNIVRKMFSAGRYDDCETILNTIDGLIDNADTVRFLTTSLRIELAALRNQWQGAERFFQFAAAELPDSDIENCLQHVVQIAIKSNKDDVGNRLCEYVLTNLSDKKASAKTAAVHWMVLAQKSGVTDMILKRLETIRKFGVDPTLTANLYSRYFYHVMTSGSKEQIAQMITFGDSILASEIDDTLRQRVKGVILDGSFIAEDYRRALRILEEGLPERSKEWHAMALNKVAAHLALQEGRMDDAVDLFRKFMAYIAMEDSKSQTDPTTGIEHSKEMILGRNAKRIGDILISKGNKDGGFIAYKEARGYYESALAGLAPDSDSYKLVESEMSSVPLN